MLDSLILQVTGQAAATAGWNMFDALAGLFIVVSGIALFIALKLRKVLQNSESPTAKRVVKILDDYVLPALNQSREFVEETKKQEIKIKQGMEIVYDFMGPELANKITDKELVKLKNMEEDVRQASVSAEQYEEKIRRFAALLDELKVATKSSTDPVPLVPTPATKTKI